LAIHRYPSFRNRIYRYEDIVEAWERPAFIHFLSRRKPWHPIAFHPHREIYEHYLRKTEWPSEPMKTEQKSAWPRRTFPWLCFWQAVRSRYRRRLRPRWLADFAHFFAMLGQGV
jgi:hypothetical protein